MRYEVKRFMQFVNENSRSESMEELEGDVSDIMRELEDEGFIIAFEHLDAGDWDKKHAYLELNISRPWNSPGRKIPGLPDPPGGLYPGRIFAWKEVKDAVIRLCDWYYSHSDREYSVAKVDANSPFRMFTGGTEFGIGWHYPEDFDGMGDAITFNSLRIAMRT